MPSRRDLLTVRECRTRFEILDPEPLEAAVVPPKPETMRDIVARYVRSMVSDTSGPDAPPSDDEGWEDIDPEDQIMSLAQAEYAVAEAVETSEPTPPLEDRVSTPPETPTPPEGASSPPSEVPLSDAPARAEAPTVLTT